MSETEEPEIIQDLRESYKRWGPIRPVIKTKFGLASGNTRRKAMPSWPGLGPDAQKRMDAKVKTYLDHLKIKAIDNLQEIKGAEWWEQLFKEAAEEYIKQGTAKHEVAKKMLADFPASKTRIWRYLPQEFKEPERVEAGKMGGRPPEEPGPSNSYKDLSPERSPTPPEEEVVNQIHNDLQKREPYAKGTSPSLKTNNPSQFTHPQVTLLSALHYLHVPYEGEYYVAVEGYRCARCGRQYYDEDIPPFKGDHLAGGRYCPEDQEMLQQITERCDIFVQTRAGFAVSIEVEGEGSSSKDNERREKLLAQKSVRTAHVSNDCAEKHPEDIASVVKAFLL